MGFSWDFRNHCWFTFELGGGYCSVSSSSRVPPPPSPSPFNACHTGYVSSTSFGDGHHSQPQETTKKMFIFKLNS